MKTSPILLAVLLAAASLPAFADLPAENLTLHPDNTLPPAIQSDPTHCKFTKIMTNFNEDSALASDLALMERASKAGYTHVLISDVKFSKWDFMGEPYAKNVRTFMDACHRLNLKVWASCAPMGYANPLLMRDPNLAEGIPVEGDFIVDQGIYLKPYDPSLKLLNGDFSQTAPITDANNQSLPRAPVSWTSSNFGKSVFLDDQVTWAGKPTLRIDYAPPPAQVSGEAAAARETSYAPGVSQILAVKPFHYYHVHAMAKTEGKSLKRGTQIAITADDPAHPGETTVLNYQTPLLPPVTDWQEFDMTFNSLEYSQVKLTLPGRQSRGGGGAGEQGTGTIWWANVTIEPGAFVNVVRRNGAPLKLTSPDGTTAYVEDKDVTPVVDPLLGRGPQAGHFTIWHTPPVISTLVGSRLHVGDIVHASYYVPGIVHTEQVMCCMCEPKTLELVQWEIAQIHKYVNPDGYFMGYDELRSQGYDKSCVDSHMSMSEILADNARRITRMIQAEDPGKDICTWSDLFDPYHNAKNDGKRYYLVKGVSPWYGSWLGLPKDVIIMNWHGPFDNNGRAAMKFFADQGHRQILSGYYDKDINLFKPRLEAAAHYPGVIGSMYTTWTNNFTQMEPFMDLLKAFKPQPATQP